MVELARHCALQGRYDEAVDWFAKARAVLDEQGARPLRAIVDYAEALMYLRRDEPEDKPRAAPLLDAALARFRELGEELPELDETLLDTVGSSDQN